MTAKVVPLVLTGSIIHYFLYSCNLPNELFDIILKDVKNDYFKKITEYIIKIQTKYRLHLKFVLEKNYQSYLKTRRKTPKDIAASMFYNIKACNCCKRHQINKPKEIKHWVHLPFDDPDKKKLYEDLNINYNCDCVCRHLARIICFEIF